MTIEIINQSKTIINLQTKTYKYKHKYLSFQTKNSCEISKTID